jgi:phage FluMu gp28-like protein
MGEGPGVRVPDNSAEALPANEPPPGVVAVSDPQLSTLNPQLRFGSHWSLHEVPIQKAVAEGIVERINKKTGRSESREDFLKRLEAECIDKEQWQQEYCCIPADEDAAFFSYDILDACTDPSLRLMTLPELLAYCGATLSSSSSSSASSRITHHESSLDASTLQRFNASTFFLGMDIARKNNLCVIDVGEKIGSIVYDRLRIELHDSSFTEIESHLYPLLRLPELKRACIDESGMGVQLAEQARERFGWKVEPVSFTQPRKEELAFALRRDFEDGNLRIPNDDKLRADLRGLKKEITPSGKLRFVGDVDDSHCDRTWAKALRQHAARHRPSAGAILI